MGGEKFVIFAVIAVIRWVAVPVMPVTPCPVSSIWAGTLVSAFVMRATVKCKPLQMSKFGGMMSVSASRWLLL